MQTLKTINIDFFYRTFSNLEPTVELLLPSCTQQSAIGHTRADDAMKTDGLTMVFTEVISSGSKGSTYESVRNQAKREKRSQFGEIMSQKNFSEFWNSNDTG
jgi:hypothetical protein